jgi:hypothetical protein
VPVTREWVSRSWFYLEQTRHFYYVIELIPPLASVAGREADPGRLLHFCGVETRHEYWKHPGMFPTGGTKPLCEMVAIIGGNSYG